LSNRAFKPRRVSLSARAKSYTPAHIEDDVRLQGKVISLIGALFCFCFSVCVLLLFGFNSLTFNEVSFYTQTRPIVDSILFVGSALLFALGLFFLRDYFRS
jgi:hypothetical protein